MSLAAVAAVVAGGLAVADSRAGAAAEVVSQGKPVTASSVENGGTAAANAVDGNAGTRWSSGFADAQWLRVDLGRSVPVTGVRLQWEAAYATAYQVQLSADGSTWTTAYSTTTGRGGDVTVAASGTGRYVRLVTSKRATQYGVSLWEFQVLSGAVVTPTGTPTSAPPATIPPGAVRVAEFLADCPFTHRLPDDPIVYPGLAGASHMHDFFGNETTNATSTYESLNVGGTNCNPGVDRSSYWVPTLYDGDTAVAPTGTTFYYLGEGVHPEVTARIQPFPAGLRIVAGNAKATGPDQSIARWSCLHAGEVGASKNFVTCPAGTMMESYLDFPQCWNGRDLDSADHKSHMAYPVNGECPSTHPVPVPKLRQVLRYPVNGNPAAFRLASGPGYTMHGDFFNAWPADELARRVRDCINPVVKCGADGRP
jgi:hypothetical protein